MKDIDPRLLVKLEQTGRWLLLNGEAVRCKYGLHLVVKDPTALQAEIPDLEITSQAGPENGTGHYFLTANATNLAAVLNSETVLVAEAPTPLEPLLYRAVADAKAAPSNLPARAKCNGGSNVVVAILDSNGLDFNLSNFRQADGSTRLLGILKQSTNKSFTSAEINAAIVAKQELDGGRYTIDPVSATSSYVVNHATAVADCAAGNDSHYPGIAPKASLVYVDLGYGNLTTSGLSADSKSLVEAAKYVFDLVGERPCVINFSQGALEGPPDGSAKFGAIREWIEGKPRAVVVSAGNYADELFTAVVEAPAGAFRDSVEFRLFQKIRPENPRGEQELNVWYPKDASVEFTLISPTGAQYGPIPLEQRAVSYFPNGAGATVIVVHQTRESTRWNHLSVAFQSRDSGLEGVWKLEIEAALLVSPTRFHAYLRTSTSNASNPVFVSRHVTRSYTLTGIATEEPFITVGAHDTLPGGSRSPAYFSSMGPTPANAQKPDISAPGVQLRVVQPGGEARFATGTSFSAPIVTGVVALCFAEAEARGIHLTGEDVKRILIESRQAQGANWNPQSGYGPIDAASMVDRVIGLAEGK